MRDGEREVAMARGCEARERRAERWGAGCVLRDDGWGSDEANVAPVSPLPPFLLEQGCLRAASTILALRILRLVGLVAAPSLAPIRLRGEAEERGGGEEERRGEAEEKGRGEQSRGRQEERNQMGKWRTTPARR